MMADSTVFNKNIQEGIILLKVNFIENDNLPDGNINYHAFHISYFDTKQHAALYSSVVTTITRLILKPYKKQ